MNHMKSAGVRTIPKDRTGDSGPIIRTIKYTHDDKQPKGKKQKSFASENKQSIRNYILESPAGKGMYGYADVASFDDNDNRDRKAYIAYKDLLDDADILNYEYRSELGYLVISVKNRNVNKAKMLLRKIR